MKQETYLNIDKLEQDLREANAKVSNLKADAVTGKPVHGGWSQWAPWGTCSVSCDIGMQRRNRTCSNPYPSRNGNHFGESRDDRLCMPGACADGGWSVWGSWESCSDTCGGGVRLRSRSCTNPNSSVVGRPCTGDSSDVNTCNRKSCPDGEWSVWGSWGSCSDTCGGGVRIRSRLCTNPSPSLTGRTCTGDSSDMSTCNRQSCPDYNVAFTAYNLYNSQTSFTVLQFGDVYLNNGDAYSTATGKFTCRLPGVYYFAVTLAKRYEEIGILDVYLRISGYDKLLMFFDPEDDNSNEVVALPLTMSGTFHLNTNDTVHVQGVPSYFHSNIFSSFTGILVFPDP